MAIVPAVIATVEHSVVTTGGSPVEVAGGLVTQPTFDDQTDSIPTGKGVDRKIGSRLGFSYQYYEIDKFSALNTLQIAGTPRRFTFTFQGPEVYRIDPAYFTVVPVIGQLSDKAKIWVAAQGTATTPTSMPGDWTDLGRILGGTSPDFSVVSKDDGAGLPIYIKTDLSFECAFIEEKSTELATYYDTEGMIAIDHGDSTYTKFDRVLITNIPGIDDLVVTRAFITSSYRDVTAADAVIIPGGWATPTAPDFFNGVEVNAAAYGATQDAYLSINPP